MTTELQRIVFSESMKLADLVDVNFKLLNVLSRLGIGLGFGELTISEVAGRLESQANEKGVSIRVEAPESCETMCDGQLIAGAVSNLVVNAIRHSGSKDILVSVEGSSGSVSISVEDCGAGIPEEHRGRVFDRFYRVDRSRSSGEGGTGLGLAIVKSVARLHGGDVELYPVEPSGCRFVLTLPRFRS